MTLITPDELARTALLITFGGAAGACTLAWPGSPLWLLPAVIGVAGGSLTVPEVREELRRALPAVQDAMPDLRAGVERLRSTPAPVLSSDAAPAARPQAALPAARPRWLAAVNDDMDRAPHTLIVGPSGAGKTTLATAIMGDRGGRSVVLSPKVAADGWRGAEVVTLDDDGSYAPLRMAVRDLEQEKRERVVTLRRDGRAALEPLTVVFDELQDLTSHVPEAGEFMVNMSSLGREINMRLIGVGTSDDALNIRGWKASRRNYLRVELDRDRRASLDDGVRSYTVPTRDSLSAARAARLSPWRGAPEPTPEPRRVALAAETPRAQVVSVRVPECPAVEPDALLAALLADDVRAAVPDISPDRAARLASILERQQSVTVARDTGGDVHVHVQQAVSTPAQAPAGRGRAMKTGGVSAKDRRRRLEYIEAARRGERFEPTYKRLGGSRNDMHALFTANKAVRAHQEAK